MKELIINNKIINFNYYYKRVFNPMYKHDEITNFNISKIINKYYIVKSIYVIQQNILEEYLENLEEKLNSNEEYRNLININSENFFDNDSLVEIASLSYCLSRRNHLVIHIELDFIFANIEKLVYNTFGKFLSLEDIHQINNIYKQILKGYYDDQEKAYTGMFLYTDFKLNELLLTTFLKQTMFYIFQGSLNFIVYKNNILIFCSSNKNMTKYINSIKDILLQYYIYFKNKKVYNLYIDDIVFKNNILLENYSCKLKEKSIEFLKWQLEQKIEQEVPLSINSEILLLEYMPNKEFNTFKNNLKKKEYEYYKKIKYYFDILIKNGCNN